MLEGLYRLKWNNVFFLTGIITCFKDEVSDVKHHDAATDASKEYGIYEMVKNKYHYFNNL